jgi:galactokinase
MSCISLRFYIAAMDNYKQVHSKFTEVYGGECLVIKSPGRINLLGEHVDYNDGFVMPASINYATVFCIATSTDNTSEIYSIKYNEHFQVDLESVQPVKSPSWVNYLLGVIRKLQDNGYTIKPFKCVFGGDIPMGAGLSSSASLECGFAFALDQLNELNIDKLELIKIAQWSEHNFVGVKCGIMDQFASVMGVDDKVIVLDCNTLEYSYSPFKLTDHALILCDTKVKHSLVDSQYNKRREECESGLKIIQQHFSFVKTFRDVTEEMLETLTHSLSQNVFNRCLYVVQEIKRVQNGKEDLRQLKLADFGKKMFATHDGLSKLYEVSCKELDFLVEEAHKNKSVLGARMMGGGFGGCTINIVEKTAIDSFINTVKENYLKAFGFAMATYEVSIEQGTHLVNPSVKVLNQ